MREMRYSIVVEADKARVWELLSDFGTIDRYNPFVPKSYIINDAPARGLGAERHCDLDSEGKGYLRERIIEFNEGESYTLVFTAASASLPVHEMFITFAVAVVAGGTRVSMTYHYRMKYGVVGRLMEAVVVKPMLTRVARGLLSGFKHYAETGEHVHSVKMVELVQVTP